MMMSGHQGSNKQEKKKTVEYNVMLFIINNCVIFVNSVFFHASFHSYTVTGIKPKSKLCRYLLKRKTSMLSKKRDLHK